MPTYVYEILTPEGEGTGEYFEIVHSMKDAPLKKHPETGAPVRLSPQKPAIAGEMSDLKAPGKLSNKRLDKLGFTKYERQSDGTYERKAGKMGPRHLSKDD